MSIDSLKAQYAPVIIELAQRLEHTICCTLDEGIVCFCLALEALEKVKTRIKIIKGLEAIPPATAIPDTSSRTECTPLHMQWQSQDSQ